jgi:fatty-acyl-CoA synthase
MIESVNIAFWVQRWSELHPDKAAVIFKRRPITYRQLHRRCRHTAAWLRGIGIEKGDRVAVMVFNCPEFLDLYIACARLGAIFVPVNFRLSAPEVDYLIQHCDPKLFVFDKAFAELTARQDFNGRMPWMHLACIGGRDAQTNLMDYSRQIHAYRDQPILPAGPAGPADEEDPQVIMYTSGTTGQPKGAVLSYRKTFFNCLNADIFFKLQFDDQMLVVLPLFHSGGLFIQASPILYKGGTLILHAQFDPETIYADIASYRVTKLLGVPTVYRALLDITAEKHRDLSSLRVCAIGGEKTTPELLALCKDRGFPLRQIMGQTETSILLWASEEASLRKPGTVGRPVFHAHVDIFDRLRRPVAPGEVGEIVARGSIMMNAYWRDPEATRETIRGGWLYTGDLAYRDADGYFFLVDRARDMYISGGENVYPAEVERVLRRHPAVEDIAVVGVPDDTWGEAGVAYVIPEAHADPAPEEIIAYCEGRLARYKWPKSVFFRQSFPRTSLGKVRKHLLLDGR